MAKQQHKRPRKNSSAGTHQLNWLWGQRSVVETLTANRWRVYELFVTQQVSSQLNDLLKAKRNEGVEVEIASIDRLNELSGTAEHEGIVARVSKYPYASMESLEATLITYRDLSRSVADMDLHIASDVAGTVNKSNHAPLVVLMDRVQDAFTFSSILRCIHATGATGLIVGKFCQAQVTTQVSRASCGAVNHFPIIESEDLIHTTTSLKELGLQVVAISDSSTQRVDEAPLTLPTVLIVGSDSLGLNPKLIELCDHQVCIPDANVHSPLYSAVAAGIMLYEIRRQQS